MWFWRKTLKQECKCDADFQGLMAKQKEPLMDYQLVWYSFRILQNLTGDFGIFGQGEPCCELQPWKHHQNKCFANGGESSCPQCHCALNNTRRSRATEIPHGWKHGLWSSAEQGCFAYLDRVCVHDLAIQPCQKKAGGLALLFLTPPSPYLCPCDLSLSLSTC